MLVQLSRARCVRVRASSVKASVCAGATLVLRHVCAGASQSVMVCVRMLVQSSGIPAQGTAATHWQRTT